MTSWGVALIWLWLSFGGRGPATAASERDEQVPLVAAHETRWLKTLTDGNVLDRKEQGTFYRDRQGRTRFENAIMITITDPVAGFGLVLDVKGKAGKKVVFGSGRRPAARPAAPATGQPAPLSEKRSSLGQQVMDGVPVTGEQFVLTIPAGSQLGNAQPIQQVTRIWTSQELRLPVLTSTSDPLSGEKTIRFNSIRRGVDPDPALFQIPEGYVVAEIRPPR